MNKILLEEKYILEYAKDTLNDLKLKLTTIADKFHHNSSYKLAPSICKYGILSLNDLNKSGITNYTKELLDIMNDTESHINGNDKVSLSVVGLKDLYLTESEYNPYNPNDVDFLVSSEVKANRSTIHYGNEFLSKSITNDKLRSIDIRLLQLINQNDGSKDSIKRLIEKYNYLKDIATAIKEANLDIPLRERTNNFDVDIDKLSNSPKLVLK